MLHFSGLHLILVTKSVLSHFCFIAENQGIKRLRRVKQNKAEKGKLRTINRILICLNLIHHPATYLSRQKARNRDMLITVCQGKTLAPTGSQVFGTLQGENRHRKSQSCCHMQKKQCGQF